MKNIFFSKINFSYETFCKKCEILCNIYHCSDNLQVLYYFTELMFLPRNYERIDAPMKNEYIEKIESLLPQADIELLDFVFQLLQKSAQNPVIPLTETHQQSA